MKNLIIIISMVFLLLNACEPDKVSKPKPVNIETKGKETLAGTWVCDSLLDKKYPTIITIKDKYPDIKRSVYNRYSADFFLIADKSLVKTDVSYNKAKQIVALIEKHRSTSNGVIKEDLYTFWRTSLDTLKTMVNGKMYYWIRN